MRRVIKIAIPAFAIGIFALVLSLGCQPQNANTAAKSRAGAMVDKVMKMWNEGNMELAGEIYNDDVIRHDFALNQDFTGLEEQKKYIEQNRAAFPDLKLAVKEIVVEGDTLAFMWSFTGTNTGDMENMPATGKAVSFTGLSLAHLANGKVSEIWDFYNQLSILQQLGFTVTPPPEMKDK